MHKWNTERVLRLCRFLGCTQYELSALCAVRRNEMRNYLKANSFPQHIALHFAILESWYLETILKLKQEPVMAAHLLSKD